MGDCPSCGETVVAGFQNGKPKNNDLRCLRCAQVLQWEDEDNADKKQHSNLKARRSGLLISAPF